MPPVLPLRVTSRRSTLPPFPNGWYALAFSDDVGPAQVVTRHVAGTDVIVFRSESGTVAVIDAHCPHLGAHLGLGGTVVGDCVRCPFHGFQFDRSGACVATGYGTEVPAGLASRSWAVHETDGVILVWHHVQEEGPSFAVPELDSRGWSSLRHATFTLRDHPQETTENAVDLGHFAWVHGYRSVELVDATFTDGPMLRTRYTARRRVRGLGEVEFVFEPEIWGLGYSLVHVDIPGMALRARLLVLATPTDGDHVALRLASRVAHIGDRGAVHPLAILVPSRRLAEIVNRVLLRAFAGDASADFPIWENKTYVDPPRLARGDGPIGLYRKWARQFYSEASQDY